MQILDCDHVTRLILLQQLHKLGLVDYSPLDDPEFVMALGGEGVEPRGDHNGPTGPTPRKNFSATPDTGNTEKPTPATKNKAYASTIGVIRTAGQYVENERSEWGDPWGTGRRWREAWEGFNPMGCALLERLKQLEIYRIEVRVLDRFERMALNKLARLMEVDRKARKKFQAKWIRKRRHAQARYRRSNRKQAMKKKMMQEQAEQAATGAADPVLPEIDGDEASGENGETKRGESLPEQKEIIPGDISTYPTGPWPEGTVERVREQARSMEGVGEVPVVEMEVIRVGPNPRVVLCRYRLGDGVETVNVWVHTNKNFKRSMRFRMTYQEGREWKYEGKLPRFLGRW